MLKALLTWNLHDFFKVAEDVRYKVQTIFGDNDEVEITEQLHHYIDMRRIDRHSLRSYGT